MSLTEQVNNDKDFTPVELWAHRAEQLNQAIFKIEEWALNPLSGPLPVDIQSFFSTPLSCTRSISCNCGPCVIRRMYAAAVCDLTSLAEEYTRMTMDYESHQQQLQQQLQVQPQPQLQLQRQQQKELFEVDEVRQLKLAFEALRFESEMVIKQKDLEIERKDLLQLVTHMALKCTDMKKSLLTIQGNISSLCNCGNAPPSSTDKTKPSATTNENPNKNITFDLPDIFGEYPFLRGNAKIDHKQCWAEPDCTNEVLTLLNEFREFLEYGFANATVIPGDDLHFQETLRLILAWESGAPFRKFAFHCKSLNANEVEVSHKLLSAFMFKMRAILKVDSHITHEQRTIAFWSPERKIDFVVGRVAQHVSAKLAAMCVLPLEVKALHSSGCSFEHLQRKGMMQVIGHLASCLMHSFMFGGVGIDGKFGGALLSLLSVQTFELELVGAGTPDISVLFRKSGTFPLFSERTTNYLLSKSDEASNFEAIFGVATPDQGQGFRILAGLMSPKDPKPHFDQETSIYTEGDNTKLTLCKYLGSGTFSHVYELSSRGSFLKVPKHPYSLKLLSDEKSILDEMDHPGIPKAAAELGLLRIQVRCETSTLKCLRMNGLVGMPASKFPFESNDQVAWVCRKMIEALDHAHKKRIAHLDVRTANIVLSLQPSAGKELDDEMQVQLIDWGCAVSFGRSMSKFVGSLPFARDDLLSLKSAQEWKAMPHHDLASLGYTLTTIMYGMDNGSPAIPWSGFYKIPVSKESLGVRNKMAQYYLSKLDGGTTLLSSMGVEDEVTIVPSQGPKTEPRQDQEVWITVSNKKGKTKRRTPEAKKG